MISNIFIIKRPNTEHRNENKNMLVILLVTLWNSQLIKICISGCGYQKDEDIQDFRACHKYNFADIGWEG